MVKLSKDRGFKGLGFLHGNMLLAKGTGPENIIKCQYSQQLHWLERKRRDTLSGSKETEKPTRDKGTLRDKI